MTLTYSAICKSLSRYLVVDFGPVMKAAFEVTSSADTGKRSGYLEVYSHSNDFRKFPGWPHPDMLVGSSCSLTFSTEPSDSQKQAGEFLLYASSAEIFRFFALSGLTDQVSVSKKDEYELFLTNLPEEVDYSVNASIYLPAGIFKENWESLDKFLYRMKLVFVK